MLLLLLLHSSSFDYFKLCLGTNPLRCDCDLRWLYSKLRAAAADGDSFRLAGLPWSCDDGRRFVQLTDADFDACPPPHSNCSAVVPPPDNSRNSSAGTDELPVVLQASVFLSHILFHTLAEAAVAQWIKRRICTQRAWVQLPLVPV